MNIKEELRCFDSSDKFGDKLIEDIEFQQKELQKKLHLVKVISVSKHLENIANTDFFNGNNIEFLVLQLNEQNLQEKFYSILFSTLDKNRDLVSNYIDEVNLTLPGSFILKVFDKIQGEQGLEYNLISNEFQSQPKHLLELKPGIGEKIINLFLSKELKKIYEYSKMQLELHNDNQNNLRKIKV